MCFFGALKIHFDSQAMSNVCDIKHETKNKLYNDDPEKNRIISFVSGKK